MGFTNLNLDLRDIILGYKTTHGKYNLVNCILIVMTFTIFTKVGALIKLRKQIIWLFLNTS